MKTLLISVAVVMFGGASVALAQPHPPMGHPPGRHHRRCAPPHLNEAVARYDQNGNGHLEPYERYAMMEARRREDLARYDLDLDGRLNPQEFKAMHAARLRTHFETLDQDRSGSISLDEAQLSCSALKRDFERLDLDGDGSISLEEFGRAPRPPAP